MESKAKGKFIDNQAREMVPNAPGPRVLKAKDIGITYGGKIKIPLDLAKRPDRSLELGTKGAPCR